MALLLSLCLAPCIAYLFKLAFDWYFQQDIDRYTSQRLRRLSKLRHDIRQPAPGPLPPRQTHHNNALLSLISHIQADFILPWYSRVSPSSTFPSAIESLLLHCTDSAALRFSHVDIPILCATRILPKLTRHFDEYRKIEHLLYPTGTFSSSRHHHPSHTVNPAAILQSHHKHLHPALPTSTLANPLPSVQAYLGARVVEPLLKALLPKEEQSRAVMALTREVVASCVLLPLVDMLSEPDFWNQMISDKMDPYIQERNQVSQLRRAIETASMAGPNDLRALDTSSVSPRADPLRTPVKSRSNTISVKTDAKSFDVFLSSVAKVQSLTEAKRLRNDVDREIRALKNTACLSSSEEQRRKEEAHLKRLEKARRKIEKRIERLQGKSPSNGNKPASTLDSPYEPTLRQILDDPSSLVLFTEFMGRRGQSNVISFWLAVNSFQTPLDNPDVISSDSMQLLDVDMVYEDLSLLWARFLRPDQGCPLLGLNAQVVETIGNMVSKERSQVNRQDVSLAQQSAFKAQREAYQLMLEDQFPAFKETDLYRKAVLDIQAHHQSLMEQQGRASLDGMGSPQAQISSPQLLSPNQPPKWLSLSSHFPSFTKANRTAANEQDLSLPDSIIEEDTQTTPKRPTALRGRARRISNAFNNMRSPSINDTRDVAPALGFLIGSSPEHHDGVRKGIFDDEEDEKNIQRDEHLGPERDSDAYVEIQRMEAIQAALTSIMERDDRSRSGYIPVDRRHSTESFYPRQSRSSLSTESLEEQRLSFDPLGARQSFDNDGFLSRPQFSRGSQSQLKAMGISPDYTGRRDRVFDDDPDDDEESLADSVELGSPTPSSRKLSDVFDGQELSHRLNLDNSGTGAEIEWIRARLAHIREQDTILDKMIRAADLKGSAGQHRLLVKSQNDLRLEIQALTLQRQQYEQLQQNSDIHPERTRIRIPNATVLAEDAGKQIVRYLIKVEQRGDDGSVLSEWTVPRRFNEFFDLHQILKADPRLAEVFRKKKIEVPAKKLMPKLSQAFVDARRRALEIYLTELLGIPLACEHAALRRFLSQRIAQFKKQSRSKHDYADTSPIKALSDSKATQSLYQSFATSIDDILARPSMLEVVSENLGKQAGDMISKYDASVAQAGQLGLEWGSAVFSPVLSPFVAGLGDTLDPFDTTPKYHAKRETTNVDAIKSPMIGSICDFLLQLLDYKDNDWLRKPALLLILKHFMGSTIERKIRETCETAISAQAGEKYIKILQDMMWPNGTRRSPSTLRTDEEKLRTRNSAASKVQALIPDIAANMIGRNNVRRAVRRSFGVLQVKVLNLHLILTIIDELVNAMLKEPKDYNRSDPRNIFNDMIS